LSVQQLHSSSVKENISGMDIKGTFQVLCCEQNRADAVVLYQSSDLWGDGGSIKAHHEQLAKLSVDMYA
jgi:hypothetical protein